jgi:hypothetical protein
MGCGGVGIINRDGQDGQDLRIDSFVHFFISSLNQ